MGGAVGGSMTSGVESCRQGQATLQSKHGLGFRVTLDG